jgi:hypothetical protein
MGISPKPFHNMNMCVRFLEKTQTCKHLVYLSSPAVSRRTISLAQIISLISPRGSAEGLPLLKRLRLAKFLAAVILQYHATPWMQGSWRSEDVLFFSIDETTLPSSLALLAPHPNTTPMLFSFGIVGTGSGQGIGCPDSQVLAAYPYKSARV